MFDVARVEKHRAARHRTCVVESVLWETPKPPIVRFRLSAVTAKTPRRDPEPCT